MYGLAISLPRGRRDQRRDPRRLASLHIGRAEVAGIGQQGLGLAQIRGQGGKFVQHRRELPLVVGSLDDVSRDHQQAARGDHRLGIVALLEDAARHRHDARFLVGQVDLIG